MPRTQAYHPECIGRPELPAGARWHCGAPSPPPPLCLCPPVRRQAELTTPAAHCRSPLLRRVPRAQRPALRDLPGGLLRGPPGARRRGCRLRHPVRRVPAAGPQVSRPAPPCPYPCHAASSQHCPSCARQRPARGARPELGPAVRGALAPQRGGRPQGRRRPHTPCRCCCCCPRDHLRGSCETQQEARASRGCRPQPHLLGAVR